MEFEKISNLSDDELKSEQVKAAEQLFRIRFQKSLGNVEGIKKLRGRQNDIRMGGWRSAGSRCCPSRQQEGGAISAWAFLR